MRRWFGLAAVVLVPLVVVAAGESRRSARSRWVMQDLGTSFLPSSYVKDDAVDDRFEIVGVSADGPAQAVIWRAGRLTRLPRPGAGWSCFPIGINASGQVAGNCVRYRPVGNTRGIADELPFSWKSGRITYIRARPAAARDFPEDLTDARAINDAGQILLGNDVGSLLWRDGKVTDLGYLRATALNDRGEVVGSFDGPKIWREDTLRDLEGDGDPTAINDRGDVVGNGPRGRAVLWRSGRWIELGVPTGRESTDAYTINERGQVAGQSYASGRPERGYVWRSGRMTDLGALVPGGSTFARAIDDSGRVIGWSSAPSRPEHAVVWENGTLTDLGTLDGGAASEALAVGPDGVILGQSTVDRYGPQHAVLWTLKSS